MDEDICIHINASMRMGIGISLGTGMGPKVNNGCQSIHPHKFTQKLHGCLGVKVKAALLTKQTDRQTTSCVLYLPGIVKSASNEQLEYGQHASGLPEFTFHPSLIVDWCRPGMDDKWTGGQQFSSGSSSLPNHGGQVNSVAVSCRMLTRGCVTLWP